MSNGIKEIEDRIGFPPNGGFTAQKLLLDRLDPSLASSLTLRADLKLWAQKMGITPTSAQKALDTSLAKAYTAPAYLKSWRQNVNPQWGLLDGLDDEEEPTAEPTAEAAPPTASIDSKLLLAQAEDTAKRIVDDKLANMTLSAKASEQVRLLATTAATTAALRALENALPPRTIEIKHAASQQAINLGQQHERFPRLLKHCQRRDHRGFAPNIWLTGPTGSGKTTAAENCARALEPIFTCYRKTTLENGKTAWTIFDEDGNTGDLNGLSHDGPFGADGSLDADYKVIGFKDANGHFHWTTFLRIFVFGGIYVADEIDNWNPSALLALNSALANGWVSTPIGILHRNKNCIVIAAANTWGMGATNDYVGRTKLDAASMDRFAYKLEWPVDEKLERAIAFGMGGEKGVGWHNVVLRARAAIKRQGLKIIVSPRCTINGVAALLDGDTEEEVLAETIYAGLSEEQIAALALKPTKQAELSSTDRHFEDELRSLIAEGLMITAIKKYREYYEVDLRTAKDACEALAKEAA